MSFQEDFNEKEQRLRVALSPSLSVYQSLQVLSTLLGMPIAQVAYHALLQGLPRMLELAEAVPRLQETTVRAGKNMQEYLKGVIDEQVVSGDHEQQKRNINNAAQRSVKVTRKRSK